MNTERSPLGGKQISRETAFKGLGNPKLWEKDAAELMVEFQKTRPQKKRTRKFFLTKAIKGILKRAQKVRKGVAGFIAPHAHPQPALAKHSERKRKLEAKRPRPHSRRKRKPARKKKR